MLLKSAKWFDLSDMRGKAVHNVGAAAKNERASKVVSMRPSGRSKSIAL